MFLNHSKLIADKTLEITGSKSISNRLLILNRFFENLEIENISNSQDTILLKTALESDSEIIDIHHAGTAMRFLTSYFAVQADKTVILTGSERMKQRPIKPLVEALKNLGAEIYYLENEGFAPLKIFGKKIEKSKITIPADVSSQFISSLMMIGAKLKNGLEINLLGKITSLPYLEMTMEIMKKTGISITLKDNTIKIFPFNQNEKPTEKIKFTVESDWSSASYFYSLVAIGRETINLKNFKINSLQGDSILKKIYQNSFGMSTFFEHSKDEISIRPEQNFSFPEKIYLDLINYPDIAQTICVTASALKIPFEITGLHTLKIKETDRLSALKNELYKIGCIAEITENSISSRRFFTPENNISISTYNDHRMAMSFAPFCLIKELNIENHEVTEKSYPDFWRDLSIIIEKI
jgi:3-phosphoshikimate 1-carboxyvinyltransferase